MKEETMTALKAMVLAGRYVNRCREYVRALKSYVSHQRGCVRRLLNTGQVKKSL
jgi:hypothetical protein